MVSPDPAPVLDGLPAGPPLKLSVALSTYNGKRFLQSQLASLSAQHRLPDEVVIRDDCSTDGTYGILERFVATAPFAVTLMRGDRRLGSTPSFELALGRCTGDVVALCDQDDVWRPNKLSALEDVFRRRPEVGVVISDADLIDERGARLGYRIWQLQRFDGRGRWAIRRDPFPYMLSRYSAPGCTVAFRACYSTLYLPFPSAMRMRNPPVHHDRWVATIIGAAAQVEALAEPLIEYRLHDGQQVGLGPWTRGRRGRPYVLRAHRARLRLGDVSDELGSVLRTFPVLREYFVAQREVDSADRALEMIDNYLQHAEFRQSLSPNRLARFPRVVAAWRSGDYHRFANGVWSVGGDFLKRSGPSCRVRDNGGLHR
jgi:glycosyltransferase involved in cell wall biosynthesis